MSSLFFKVSWQHNIDRFKDMQKQARRSRRSLTVKNVGPRGCPIFLFFLSRTENPDRPMSFSSLDDVAKELSQEGGAI